MNLDIKQYGLALFLICLGLTGTTESHAAWPVTEDAHRRTASKPRIQTTVETTPETYIRAARTEGIELKAIGLEKYKTAARPATESGH